MKIIKSIFLVLMGFSVSLSVAGQFVTHHNAIYQGDLAQPLPGVQITDPNFHTPLMRLTNARAMEVPGFVPDYSKRQAWNSNETLMLLRSTWSDTYLFNGVNYQYIKMLDGVAGEDVFWDPNNPGMVLFCPDSNLYRYNVNTDEVTLIHSFAPFNMANTKGEGNLSNDGRYYAVAERYYNFETGEVTYYDLAVYDFVEDRIISRMDLPQDQLEDFDWVSISPLGNYVVVDYASWEKGRYRGLEVYDRNFNLIWQKGLGPGHSDMGLDANGKEVLIMDVYSDNDNMTHICKFDLATGDSTDLLKISYLLDLHESCRAMARPGWVYVSTFDYFERLTDNSTNWLPFEDEVFALKMDGSGTVERIAHHRSKEYSIYTPNRDSGALYFAEPRATVSRSGNRVIFGSNWRIAMNEEASIDVYLVDLRNLITGTPEIAVDQDAKLIKVFPNPVADHLIISGRDRFTSSSLTITDPLGRTLKEVTVNENNQRVDLSNLPPGIYYYRVMDSKHASLNTGKLVKL